MAKRSTALKREEREKKGKPPPITIEDFNQQVIGYIGQPVQRHGTKWSPTRNMPYDSAKSQTEGKIASKYGYQSLSDLKRGWELYNTQSETASLKAKVASLKAKLAKIEQRRRRRVQGLDATTRGTLLGGFTGAIGAAPTQRKRLLGR